MPSVYGTGYEAFDLKRNTVKSKISNSSLCTYDKASFDFVLRAISVHIT